MDYEELLDEAGTLDEFNLDVEPANDNSVYEPLFKEVKTAVGLYKEALDKQTEELLKHGITITTDTKEIKSARDYMYSFLETIQYEDDLNE